MGGWPGRYTRPLRVLVIPAVATLLAACGDHAPAVVRSAAATPSVAAASASAAPSPSAAACPITTPSAVGPHGAKTAGGMTGDWYVSQDGRLGVLRGRAAPWLAGEQDIKVPWLRPVGATLRISGRRLDGPASPLQAWVPDGYSGEFQVSGLTFPAPGCWQIEGRAGDSVVRFVVAIPPAS
jgi:hypothetical protein